MLLGVVSISLLGQAGLSISAEGRLAVVSSCSLDHSVRTKHECRQDLVLVDGKTSYRLTFREEIWRSLPKNRDLIGRYWRVHGSWTDSSRSMLRVDRWIEDFEQAPHAEKATIGKESVSKPYLTVLAKYSDFPTTEPKPKSWYEAMFAATTPSLSHYFNEQSYQTIDLNGSTVVGWITLPQTKAYYFNSGAPSGPDYDKVSSDVIAQLDPTTNFANYDGINVILNDPAGDVGGRGGRRYLTLDGQSRTWGITVNNPTDNLFNLLAHEMGHAFGMDHSAGPYSTSYDSRWDQMSGGNNWTVPHPTFGALPTHTNGYHRSAVGWMPNTRILEAYPGTNQTIKIQRTSSPGSAGFAMARIWQGSGQNYYTVEFRRYLSNYDTAGNNSTGMPGEAIVIHDVDEYRVVTDQFNGSQSRDRNSRVVDLDNDGDPNDWGGNAANDAQWKPGETFTDSVRGITIRVNSFTATEADVTITVSSSLPQPNWVTSTRDSGQGSLRGAMNFFKVVPEAAATKKVEFRIPTNDPGYAGGVWTIKPLTDLEVSACTVDGATQNAFAGNTNPNGPEVIIDGSDPASNCFSLIMRGDNATVKGLGVHSMDGPGVWITGYFGTGRNNKLVDCTVGLAANGVTPKPSGQHNISITDGASNTRIENCVSSGSIWSGITTYNGATGSVITGCRVGTNASGTAAVPNGHAGINLQGGTINSLVTGNLASGNTSQGIVLYGPNTTGNVITNNVCGLNAGQTAAIPNAYEGVTLVDGANNNRVGGPNLADRNILAGNTNGGFWISNSSGNTIQNNYVGCNASGTLIRNTNGAGVLRLGATNNSIVGNVMVGGQYNGVYISEETTTGNTFDGNTIGWLPNGTAAGFGYDAVILHNGPRNNTVRNNFIGNGSRCLLVFSDAGKPIGTGNTFSNNRLKSPVSKSIDLAGDGLWGVTANDFKDVDTGPNNLQNFPVLTNAIRTNAGTQITGTLNSTPNRSFTLEFFSSDALESSGYGPGERPLGSVTVTTNGNGDASFTANVGGAIGGWMTATATDNVTKDTSEFSAGSFLPNGLALMSLNPTSVNGGSNSTATIEFGEIVTSNTVVNLASSNTAAAQVPSSAIVASGARTKTFTVTTSVVTANTNVTISASQGGITKSATLTVMRPIALNTFSLAATTLEGGLTTTATVTLTAAAPSGGMFVTFSSSSPDVLVPASVLVAAGSTSANITVSTMAIGTRSTGIITALGNSVTRTATLTVTPTTIYVTGFTVSPATVKGGNNSVGTITFSRAVPANYAVGIGTNAAGVTVPSNLPVAAGQTSISFVIGTPVVTSTRRAWIIVSRARQGRGEILDQILTINP
jgi:M6 family metalloprotease-like protein